MDTAYEYKIGQLLRTARMNQKLTQEEAAAQLQVLGCDITRGILSRIEIGERHIYPDELKLFSQIYHISIESLFP